MHTIPELGTSVPAFLAKLWKLVEDPETDDLICWSPVSRRLIYYYQILIFPRFTTSLLHFKYDIYLKTIYAIGFFIGTFFYLFP